MPNPYVGGNAGRVLLQRVQDSIASVIQMLSSKVGKTEHDADIAELREAIENIDIGDIGDLTGIVKGVSVAGVDLEKNEDGVVNIPKAGVNVMGAVSVNPDRYGIGTNASGVLYNRFAQNTDIDSRENTYIPITPAKLDYAVRAAMTDGKGAEWLDTEKEAARNRIGAIADADIPEEATDAEIDAILDSIIGETGASLEDALDGKQDTIADLDAIRSGAAAGATALQEVPVSGNGTTGGIAVDSYLNTQIVSGNKLSCVSREYERLKQLDNGAFISKGTLESIKSDYVRSALTDPNQTAYTDAEKAAARARIQAAQGGDFELILDVTLAEKAMLSVNKDSNGNDLSLSKAYILITSPAGTPSNTAVIYAYSHHDSTDSSYILADWECPTGNDSYNYTAQMYAEVIGGRVYQYCTFGNTGSPVTPYSRLRYGSEVLNSNTTIKHIANYAYDDYWMNAGTRVQIWGVRA